MKTFIYETSDSPKLGYNVRVTVYRVKNNVPHEIGHSDHNTAAWKGASGCAGSIISKHLRIRTGFNGYDFTRNDIAVYKLGSTWNEVRKP